MPKPPAAAQAPPGPAYPAPLELSPELSGGMVRVSVKVGGSEEKIHAGAILHASTPGLEHFKDGTSRVIVAMLPEATGEMLKSEACEVTIERNVTPADGPAHSSGTRAKLLAFDEATKLALFFLGLPPKETASGGLKPTVLPQARYLLFADWDGQHVQIADQPFLPFMMPRQNPFTQGPAVPSALANAEREREREAYEQRYQASLQRYEEEKKRYEADREKRTRRKTPFIVRTAPAVLENGLLVHAPQANPFQEAAALVLGGDGGLEGFAARTPEGWTHRPIQAEPLRLMLANSVNFQFIPAGLTARFGGSGEDIEATVYGQLLPVEALRLRWKYAVAKLEKPQSPLTEGTGLIAPMDQWEKSDYLGNTNYWALCSMKLPKPAAGATVHYLAQLAFEFSDAPSAHAFVQKPFILSLSRRGEAVDLTCPALPVEDTLPTRKVTLAETSALPRNATVRTPSYSRRPRDFPFPLQQTALKEILLEAELLQVKQIREGRELLCQINAAPFWRRLSLEKQDWLPLPEGMTDATLLAGNQDAIFALDTATRKLARYDAETLEKKAESVLPAGFVPRFMSAGQNSRFAPLALSGNRLLQADARDLKIDDGLAGNGDTLPDPADAGAIISSGDGLKFQLVRQGNPNSTLGFSYEPASQAFGTRSNSQGAPGVAWHHIPDGTAMKYTGHAGQKKFMTNHLEGSGNHLIAGAFPSAPLHFSVKAGITDIIPAEPARIFISSYLSGDILAHFALPEIAEMEKQSAGRFLERSMWLDSRSMTLAIQAGPGKLCLRRLDRAQMNPANPALLNFPEGMAVRGEEFIFKPDVLSAKPWELQVLDAPPGLSIDPRDQSLHWQVPPDLMKTVVSLPLQLKNKGEARAVDFSVPVMLHGTPPVLALPAGTSMPRTQQNMRPDQAYTADAIPAAAAGLSSRVYASERPIAELMGGLDDYLVLLTDDKTLDLFSLAGFKTVASIPLSDKTQVFPAGDALFTFDPANKTLARLGVPGLKAEATYLAPGQQRLLAFAVGEEAQSPVTVLLENQSRQSAGLFVPPRRTVRFLDKASLKPGNFAPYHRKLPPPVRQDGLPLPLFAIVTDPLLDFPLPAPSGSSLLRLPASRDGRVIQLAAGQVFAAPSFSTGALSSRPLPSSNSPENSYRRSAYARSTDPEMEGRSGNAQAQMSTCGNYLASMDQSMGYKVNLYSSDGFRPLMTLDRLLQHQASSNDSNDSNRANLRPLAAMGGRNKLFVLSQSGRRLQMIDLNLGETLKKIAPGSAVVTSRAVPWVMAGQRYEYQITVSDPAAVESYKLRDELAGASIDAGGKFVFQAPAGISEVQTHKIGAQIVLKNGGSILHEFTLHVIPGGE